MELKSIKISNYKSIEELEIPLHKISDGSYTYGLIGVNESGKSSILTAISLVDNFQENKPTISDFKDKSIPIEVRLKYSISTKESLDYELEKEERNIDFIFEVDAKNVNAPVYSLNGTKEDENEIDTILYAQNTKQYQLFNEDRHKTIFWKYDPKYLIEKEVVFQPQNAIQIINGNIPLKNCFKLANIDLINFGQNILDSTERESFQELLSEKVTDFVRKMWPNEKLKIKFNLTENKINFHVRDGLKSQKISQRSDGFRQFLSFLLSISFENVTDQLENTIILLDEPEVHLHPQAQLFFLEEIISLSKSKNNLLFYSTHSPFLIDKKYIERNAKIEKIEEKTFLTFFEKGDYSYARINYEIFEAEADGYHNELYGKIEADRLLNEFKEAIKKTNRKYIKIQKNGNESEIQITRSEYIRHQIHHPENKKNKKFSDDDIKKSIKDMEAFIKNQVTTV